MKITKNRLKQLIEQEVKSVLEDNTEELDEGFEHITPENIGYAIEALKQMGITFFRIRNQTQKMNDFQARQKTTCKGNTEVWQRSVVLFKDVCAHFTSVAWSGSF